MTMAEISNRNGGGNLVTANAEETKFLARLSGAERLLMAANDDLERWELREDFARAQVIAQAAGWERAASLASRLKQRASRFIVKANPPKPSGYRSDLVVPHNEVDESPPAVNPSTLRSMRAVHDKLSDEEYAALDTAAEERSGQR